MFFKEKTCILLWILMNFPEQQFCRAVDDVSRNPSRVIIFSRNVIVESALNSS